MKSRPQVIALLLAAAGCCTGRGSDGPPIRLRILAQQAAARIRQHQKSAGFWLSSYTPTDRFDHPGLQANVFVPAMIVDVLEPAAAAAGLEENLALARHLLARQYDADGLVSYCGVLGPAVSPDADDTSLIWRIAGGDRRDLRAAAIVAIKSYRTESGLYRCWLAPPGHYVNTDAGNDPNPPDAGVNMNVLMFLAKFDEPAARALYRALVPVVGQDRMWVYYKEAPYGPFLHAAELRHLGYPLQLPPELWQTPASGQGMWVSLCRQLVQDRAERAEASRGEARALLLALADRDFAAVREHPPLLYHNDLTSSIPGFYWSEDFGYALWLRLYLEDDHRSAVASVAR